MYAVIGGATYSRIKSLSFAPQVDLTGQSVPINEFTADIITDVTGISIGQYAQLYDDRNNLWADYWIVFAEHIDAHTLRVRAQSPILLLERDTLPAKMYQSTPIATVLQEIFSNTGAGVGVYVYELDNSLSSATVSGFCPEQTARDRLLWVTLSIGACVTSAFGDKVRIVPIYDDDEDPVLIPIDKTFWKPTETFNDWVTSLKVKYYAFTQIQGDPGTKEKWVEADGETYTYTEWEYVIGNDDAPAAAPDHPVTFEGNFLLNENNVGPVTLRLVKQYFRRPVTAEADIVNNAEHAPGDWVIYCADEENLKLGCIASADFSFGVQARSKLKLYNVADVEAATLTLNYMHGGIKLAQRRHLLPVGYHYTVQNPYLDLTTDSHRIIYRPESATEEGTLAEDTTETVNCEPALDLDLNTGVLEVISVDEVNIDSEGVVRIT